MPGMEDQFELELKEAFERRPAPPGLKTRIMAARRERQQVKRRLHSLVWMRLAASLLIAVLIGGAVRWDYERIQERRRGEAARQQVLTALRITGHALELVQQRLSARNRGNGE
jgi:hypothetical protein